MPREPKFNFISEDVVGKTRSGDGNGSYVVSLTKTVVGKQANNPDQPIYQYQVYFPKEVLWLYDLTGKRLKFYLDSAKKAIAWRIIEGNTTLDELKTGRIIKPWKSGGWSASVTGLIKSGDIKIETSRRSIPVKTYSTPEYLNGTKLFYIEL